ncbi:uncharacterized protein LOC107793370 [Nicotiana tabacum]|uniref:Uncharacterized protein LOC107793370 n=2 Tax=Nicotiana TaxID=4085 RepID=A0A1S4A3P3_TOBAC|nr:PREDICTED: uncharacterized protein LOC104247334 [Nicotiana sylvestris]XP_016471191.1 PREDICTED: uncharacterized protein LOC107793370 [Nicotiana tabacum]
MIESLSSWFTPTVLFCVLNLMIGIILISSSFKNDKKQQQQQQYAEDNNLPQPPRTPSLLQRVRSVNYFSFVPEPFNSPLTTPHFADNSSPRLGYSPSLLQRVRSINFSFSSRSEKPSPFPSLDQYAGRPADENEPQKVETVTVTEEEEDLQCHVMRSKSTTCAETTLMKKLASEEILAAVQKEEEEEEEVVVVRQRPATVRERKQGMKKSFGRDDEATVDRKADDFISKFREQLKMQRIDSIQRYKEMLNRGVSI